MIAADTNVLIRILVDDPGQADEVRAAHRLAEEAEQMFIPQIVQAEVVQVLHVAYRLRKAEIIRILEHLLHNQALVLQSEACFMEAITAYKRSKAGFTDCLIAAESKARGHALFTFDEVTATLPGARLVA